MTKRDRDTTARQQADGIMKVFTHLLFTAQAFAGFVLYDIVTFAGGPTPARSLVKKCPVFRRRPAVDAAQRLCDAVAEASVWYPKRSFCLQRSMVATWLLRLHGLPAELVIGCRTVPVKSHAWVEVNGVVVNDRPQYQKFFSVLERL